MSEPRTTWPEPILIAAAGITGLIIFWIRGAL